MKKGLLLLGVLAFALFLWSVPSQATLLFEYNYEFSGATPPEGPAPWLTATFDTLYDNGDAIGVQLTLSTDGLVGTEFIAGANTTADGWFFNLNPALDPDDLVFIPISGHEAAAINTGADEFKADGDGLYDIVFGWDTKPYKDKDQDGFPDEPYRLVADETVVYAILLAGLTESDFDYLSAPDGGNGPFLSAAHVQGIGEDGEGSGWVAPGGAPVPEPATMLLLGTGLIGLAGLGRRKFFKK